MTNFRYLDGDFVDGQKTIRNLFKRSKADERAPRVSSSAVSESSGTRSDPTLWGRHATGANDLTVTTSSSSPLDGEYSYLISGTVSANSAGTVFVETPLFQVPSHLLGKAVELSMLVGGLTTLSWDVCIVRYNSSYAYQEKIILTGNTSGGTPGSSLIRLNDIQFNAMFLSSSTSTDYYAVRFRKLSGSENLKVDRILLSTPEQKVLSKNYVINGNFSVWQRATSQTATGYGSDDRWVNGHFTSTKTHSRQAFTFGQVDVPGNPTYFSRTVVTTANTASCFTIKDTRIPGVATLSGRIITVSFWAKADANRNLTIEFEQYFGSGGSPSAFYNFGQEKFALTTSWRKIQKTVHVPSVLGKTVGTNGDDFFQLSIWLDAGSDYNARTQSLGPQSGTFDIAQVQIEEGPYANDFAYRSYSEELNLCQAFYEFQDSFEIGPWWSGNATSGVAYYITQPFKVQKFLTPTVTITNTNLSGFPSVGTPSVSKNGFRIDATANATANGSYFRVQWKAEGEL